MIPFKSADLIRGSTGASVCFYLSFTNEIIEQISFREIPKTKI